MSVINSIILIAAGSVITIFSQYFTKVLQNRIKKNEEKIMHEISSFESMLQIHHKIFKALYIDGGLPSNEVLDEHLQMIQKLMIWSNDEVLSKYALYISEINQSPIRDLKDKEVQFGKAVLEFRKQLGYKNKGISPDKIALIFKAGWKDSTI
jgi:hypothetical protein